MKQCIKCGELKDASKFHKSHSTCDGLQSWCRECKAEHRQSHQKEYAFHARTRRHELGIHRPYNKNRNCPLFLGVGVAEQVLAKVYPNVVRMPMHNTGFDFICGRGYKVDVKSSCLHKHGFWGFNINKNAIADHFLCLAFNDRVNLTPQHVWLIPGKVVSHLVGLSICPGARSLSKWQQYEQSIDCVVSCCNVLREKGTVI